MAGDTTRLEHVEPSEFTLPAEGFKEKCHLLARKAGIFDRRLFASGWAQRKQDLYETRFEAKIGGDNYLPFGVLQLAKTLGDAVCKIEAKGMSWNGLPGTWSGTGFLVAPSLLLTNHHVLNTIDVAKSANVIFNYQASGDGGQTEVSEFRLKPDKLFITSPATGGLDYTFVALDGNPEKKFGVIPLNRGSFVTDFMKRANVIQHPDGRPKTIVWQDNHVLPDDHPLFLHYTTDTEGGSSGAPVFDNNWHLKALHHASRKNLEQVRPEGSHGPALKRMNEGIKIAAIATDLELRLKSDEERAAAQSVLKHIRGEDSVTGYFGVRGRRFPSESTQYLEAVVETYYGKEQDIDIAFWNVEWFNRDYHARMKDVAGVIADQNIDIWAFSENSPEATKALVDHMQREFGQRFNWAASEPDAPTGRQTTTVMWNVETVHGVRRSWPEKITKAFKGDSRDFDDIELEAVEGKIFNRFPGLFYFSVKSRPSSAVKPFDFNLVPLHLKAKAEGSKRRKMASELLARAIKIMVEQGHDQDWILGGDFNAELKSGDLDPLKMDGFTSLSARDEKDGAFSYLSKRYPSLIDHIFLSPNMSKTNDDADFFVLAKDKKNAKFAGEISDHRPVVARLSLKKYEESSADHGLGEIVNRYRDRPATLLRMIADELDEPSSENR